MRAGLARALGQVGCLPSWMVSRRRRRWSSSSRGAGLSELPAVCLLERVAEPAQRSRVTGRTAVEPGARRSTRSRSRPAAARRAGGDWQCPGVALCLPRLAPQPAPRYLVSLVDVRTIELSAEPPTQGDRLCPVGPGPCHGPHRSEQVAKASPGAGPPEPLSTFHTSIIWNHADMSRPEGRMSMIIFSGFSCVVCCPTPY